MQPETLVANSKALLSTDLREFDLSVRTKNVLQNANIHSVGELARCDEQSLLRLQNCGTKTVAELRGLLQELGLKFGMEITADDVVAVNDITPPSQPDISIRHLDKRSLLLLLLRADELNLSVRATNMFSAQ